MLDGKPSADEAKDQQHEEQQFQEESTMSGRGHQEGVDEAYAVPVPPPEAQDTNGRYGNNEAYGEQHDTVTFESAKEKVFSNGGYPLLVFVASIILTITASTACSDDNDCSGKHGFAVAAGVISLVVSAAYIALDRVNNLTPKLQLGLVVFFFAWWVFVAGFTTFGNDAPFVVPGNGYFAAWGGLLCSIVLLANAVGRVQESIDRFAKVGHRYAILLVSSAVVLIAGASLCTGNGCNGNSGYAIAVGAISFVVVLTRVLLGAKFPEAGSKPLIMFLIVWWTVALIVLTFFNPFQDVGNGYFATWASLICSVLLLNH
ncbi:Hypothetical Protein FCC1311_076692 [Hondaea fermentalgiana]|uniref:Uncharacterized protein n=1 Tax=Hondaea fermentalgiana TaxID=2315210 RepID=A0A2R5GLD4_9STRA|nr:Hypothetical Protein FCC1311_076692 [Hondaea fermentalgiana]|eukprot:GBG31445.1 Hypothetical Protein FCC1311_076692 [Hondaea fermentalgiana]